MGRNSQTATNGAALSKGIQTPLPNLLDLSMPWRPPITVEASNGSGGLCRSRFFAVIIFRGHHDGSPEDGATLAAHSGKALLDLRNGARCA